MDAVIALPSGYIGGFMYPGIKNLTRDYTYE
jgi:hypothetical protein